MPLAKITLDSKHSDRCTCGHTWALHSNIYGWCVLCDCKQYVQVAPDIEMPRKPADDLTTRSFDTCCVCGHTWGGHLHAHPTARCGFCTCLGFNEGER